MGNAAIGNTGSVGVIGNNSGYAKAGRYRRCLHNQRRVTNATGKTILVYYHEEKMLTGCDSEAGERYKFISIAADLSLTFVEESIKYATVCLESDEGEKVIAENYEIHQGESFIVTAEHDIKVQK